ncbi:hypothetical protein Pmani_016920 [Petrolisthes manimaculis]|uniref:Uncharacterized protein n=1 Tax=Petrolisthes manimaculis TaxID=1843537 RepID=A0AAE1PNF9_9EUCA|nr:hypothetical protein Pmani_016920 [Petrolisthes manimaculis]
MLSSQGSGQDWSIVGKTGTSSKNTEHGGGLDGACSHSNKQGVILLRLHGIRDGSITQKLIDRRELRVWKEGGGGCDDEG